MAKGKGDSTLDLGSWFILRMASSDTLSVARGLANVGYDAWTPIERRKGRMPRTRTEYDKEFAVMPSYVFVNVQHLREIQHLAMLPPRSIPRFVLFQYQGGVPLIADSQLSALREEEDRLQAVYNRACRKGKPAPKFDNDAIVRVSEGDAFAGMEGEVVGQQGQYTLVNFAGFGAPIKIASILLAEDEAETKAA